MKNQSAFTNLRVLIGLFIMLCGVFFALLGFGAFPASPAGSAKAQQSRNAQDQGPNANSAISQAVPSELICEDDGICVQTYARFDNDLVRFLARQDNTVRLVDTTRKNRLINTMKTFAGSIGIPRQAIQQQEGGRWYGKTVVNNEIDAYYKQDAEPELRSSAVVKARKTTRYRTAVPPISDDELKQIADGTIAQWHVPILVPGEALLFADYIHSRVVDDDTTGPMVITERVGYYRSFPGRQVINSALTVEIDPSASLASGLSLRAFWPVRPPQATTLKTFDALKSDVLKALHKNGSRKWTLNVTACSPTYYQTPAALIPSLSCSGTFIDSAGVPRDDTAGISVDISLASSYSLDESDEMSVFTSTYPDDSQMRGMQRPDSCAERSHFAFHAYYITDGDFWYDGAKKFYDKFDTGSREANLGKAWHDSRFVVTPCDQYGADWSDLIYVGAHGNIRFFEAENTDPSLDAIYTADTATTNLTQLGTGDAEYLLHTGCLTASATYCYGRTATSRYTEQSSFHSLFHGLHIFSGHHGLVFVSSSEEEDLAKTLSEYLNDGETIMEACEDTADDVKTWLSNRQNGCSEMTDPDNSCSWQYTDCSRWSAYASSFYQDGKQYVTLNNRGSYSDDVDPGDPDYDIDCRYQPGSGTVPIYSPGHSLP